MITELLIRSTRKFASYHSHEPESSRSTCLIILHHHTVDDFAIPTKVTLQAVLGRLPAEAADEELPEITITRRVRVSSLGIRNFITMKKKSCHIIKKKREKNCSGFHFWKIKVIFSSFSLLRELRFFAYGFFSEAKSTFFGPIEWNSRRQTYPFSSSSTSTPGFIRIFPLCDWIFDDFIELNVWRKKCVPRNLYSELAFPSH